METWSNPGRPLAVVAFGGNALLLPGQEGHIDEQVRNAEDAALPLLHFVHQDIDLVVVHGNGPQVGHELIRQEEASTKLPAMPLDVCVANTQGSMGYLLERAFRNLLARHGIEREVATVLSQVVVHPADDAFRRPTKPVGPFYTRFRARQLIREKGWHMVEDSGRGYRKVVPSPLPLEVLGASAVGLLARSGRIVIAGGGGGVPIAQTTGGTLRGLEAVIDKDRTAALLARRLQAEIFVILTAVDQVSVHFNTPLQEELDTVDLPSILRYREAGHFPPGSMGPKIDAAIEFLQAGGRECIITSARRLGAALRGEHGTRLINPDAPPGRPNEADRQLALDWSA